MSKINIQFTLFSAFYSPLISTMTGGFLKEELNKQLKQQNLLDEIVFEGNNWWPRLNIKKTKICL